MKKIEFDHTKEELHENFQISKERCDYIVDEMTVTVMALSQDKEMRLSEILDHFSSIAHNEAELAYINYVAGFQHGMILTNNKKNIVNKPLTQRKTKDLPN